MGKLSKKYTRTNKRKKRRKTTRRVRVKGGGVHAREDVPHYHLRVQPPIGCCYELGVLHAKSAKKELNNTDKNNTDVKSATIGDLKRAIIERESASSWDVTLKKPKPSWIMDPTTNEPKKIILFWKGKALLDDTVKLRDIIVDGERLPLYTHSKEIEPITFKLYDNLEYPSVEVIKHPDPIFEDTPEE